MSRFSGRVLIPLRSQDVKEPGTWGTWGGAIDEDESPEQAVLREVSEEAGYYGPKKVIPLHVFKDPSGFRYYNFLVLVNKEFQPRINWETAKFGWFYLDELPSPLHFGLKGIINNQNDLEILLKNSEQIMEAIAKNNKENISESTFFGVNTKNITRDYLKTLANSSIQPKKSINEYVNRNITSLENYLLSDDNQRKEYLPQQFPYFFDDFMEEEDIYFDFERPKNEYVDSNGEIAFDEELEGYDLIEWVEQNNKELYDKYANYLYAKIESNCLDVEDSEYPAWSYFSRDVKLVKNQWLIHFTNEPDDIAINGFKYGVDEIDKLGLTTQLSDFDKKYGGYNFAYLLSDFNRYGKAGHGSRGGEYKYGKEAVIFRASGLEVYHHGDEEPQVIFYGNTATNIIPINAGQNSKWAVYNRKTGRAIIESDDLEKIAYWVDKNYAQYYKTLLK
jgi:ADP-ribose pyrophosphatase YjhB (NUDIX family)